MSNLELVRRGSILNDFTDLQQQGWSVTLPEDTDDYYHIALKPPTYSDEIVGLEAWMLATKPGVINFWAVTKERGQAGRRNPHFIGNHRAHILGSRLIKSFDTNGWEVTHLGFDWGRKLGDNFSDYTASRDSFISQGDEPEFARRKAVFRTWTGKMLGMMNGFTEINEPVQEQTINDKQYIQGQIARTQRIYCPEI